MHARSFGVTQRSLGLTALAIVAVAIGLYTFVASIALLFAAILGTVASTVSGVGVFVIGALYLGISVAAFFVGGGLWLGRPWAWSGSMVVLGAVIAVSLGGVLVGATLVSVALPIVVSAAAMWYLARPALRAELLDVKRPEGAEEASS